MSLTDDDKRTLLALAREAVDAAVRTNALPQPDSDQGILSQQRGCFVTLKNAGQLRGCIGTFRPQGPLGEMIPAMARAAATEDPRFRADPIRPGELSELTVEVSVLSPLTETDDPRSLEIGTHGIYIVRGYSSGCFLPEVATEMHWDVEQFLDACCEHKAGLPAGAWKEPDTKVYLFTSEKFQR